MTSLISVVVCTYNRASLLGDVLESLVNQSLPPTEYEVVIVDNNSTDNTAAFVKDICHRHSNFHYYIELQQGLSHARNRGWREAKGQYVAYTDDDCKLPETWLTTAKTIIHEVSPPAFGGPFYPFYDAPKPDWFKDEYGSYSEGEQTHFLGEEHYLSGGNLFVKRDILELFQGFDAELGMTGKKIGLGEETELVKRIRQELGANSIYYDPNLYVYHLVSPIKYKLLYHLRRSFLTGRNVYEIFDSERSGFYWMQESAKVLASLSVKASIGILLRDKEKYPYSENYIYEVIGRTTAGLGRTYEYLHKKVFPK